MNNWLCNPLPEVEFIHGREATKDNWRNAYVDGAGNIPLLLDCAFVESKPYDFDTPPEYDGDISTYLVSALQMKRFCMNRHGEYTQTASFWISPSGRLVLSSCGRLSGIEALT